MALWLHWHLLPAGRANLGSFPLDVSLLPVLSLFWIGSSFWSLAGKSRLSELRYGCSNLTAWPLALSAARSLRVLIAVRPGHPGSQLSLTTLCQALGSPLYMQQYFSSLGCILVMWWPRTLSSPKVTGKIEQIWRGSQSHLQANAESYFPAHSFNLFSAPPPTSIPFTLRWNSTLNVFSRSSCLNLSSSRTFCYVAFSSVPQSMCDHPGQHAHPILSFFYFKFILF